MPEDGVRGRIRMFLAGRFPIVAERKLSDEDSLLDSGAIDSLGILDVVAFLEQEFGISVEDDDLNPENFDNVSALARLVESRRE